MSAWPLNVRARRDIKAATGVDLDTLPSLTRDQFRNLLAMTRDQYRNVLEGKPKNARRQKVRFALDEAGGLAGDQAVASMQEALKRCEGADSVDLVIGRHGKEVRVRADWLQHLELDQGEL